MKKLLITLFLLISTYVSGAQPYDFVVVPHGVDPATYFSSGIVIDGTNVTGAVVLSNNYALGMSPTFTSVTARDGYYTNMNVGVVSQGVAGVTNYFAGTVGIGTNAPTAILDILGGAYNSVPALKITSSQTPMINLHSLATNSTSRNWRMMCNAKQWGDFDISQSTNIFGDPQAGTSRLHIDNNGNVGIGTNVPAYTLDVQGIIQAYADSTTNILLLALRNGNGGAQGTRLEFFDRSFSMAQVKAYYRSGSDYNLVLGTYLVPTTMVVNIGCVGIGTNTPTYILEVVKGSSTDPIADSWQNHPCNRQSKHIVEENTITNYADSVASIPIYRWQRTGTTNILDVIDKDGKTNKVSHSNLPKFKTTRVGIMLDDPQIPKEICVDGDPDKGMDLVAWIGYLQAALRDEIVARKALEARVIALENKNK